MKKIKLFLDLLFYLFLASGSAFFITFIIIFGDLQYVLVTLGMMVWIIGCFAGIQRARGGDDERKRNH